MKKLFLIILTLISTETLSFGQTKAKTLDGEAVLLYEDGSWRYSSDTSLNSITLVPIYKLEIPKFNLGDTVISHTGYSFVYNEAHEQANWVAYDLTKDETTKLFDRTDQFIPDPKVSTGSANSMDYAGSGYDRGHLAPAADMGWSSTAMAESFYYSNMSPQSPSFNRGIWKKLEELVRTWAIENEMIYVVTGPVLSTGLTSIGPNKVSVPEYYYKVILNYKTNDVKGIGFIIPNMGSSEPLQRFAVSIDSVQKFTGLDFFPNLPDAHEELIEKTLCLPCWSWKTSKVQSSPKDIVVPTTESTQCIGETKAGNRCKIKTLNKSGLCYLHEKK